MLQLRKTPILMVLFVSCLLLAGSQPHPKYVFLMIGDGMGTAQRQAADLYYQSCQLRDGVPEEEVKSLELNTLPVMGMTYTFPSDSIITDSAAAATAIATGHKTRNGVLGMDATKTKKLKTIAETAKEQGVKVGIISNVWINHATPAAFYSHRPSRGMYYDIATDLATSNFDYYGGCRANKITPKELKGKPDPVQIARDHGFTITTNAEQLKQLKPGVGKVWAFDSQQGSLDYVIDRPEGRLCLNDFVKKGIELLYGRDGDRFFMMIEGGKIDWVCHSNDAATAIKDTVDFNEVLKTVLGFYEQHPDETVIIVTGDHECGGMKFTADCTNRGQLANIIDGQKGSDETFRDIVMNCQQQQMDFNEASGPITKFFNLGTLTEQEAKAIQQAYITGGEKKGDYTYGNNSALTIACTKVLNDRAGIHWTSYSHTGVPVATTAIGCGQDMFKGIYDNTDLAKKLFLLIQPTELSKDSQTSDRQEAHEKISG